MASSSPTVLPSRGIPAKGTTPTVSPDETNFLRFVNLVLRRAPKALRVHFDTVHPPSNLVTDLARQKTMLLGLKARKVIKQVQWDKLFGVPNPMSKDFDVTLLICLLRNMSPSTPAPTGGFDILPNPSDVSTGADLARIKFYRNEVAHSADARMNANDFNTSWTEVEEAIGRLGGSALLNETKALRFSPMDESEKELLLELFLEIKHLKMEQLETIPPNVRELIEEKLVSWEKEDEIYIEIRASTAVENFLKDHPCVVVVGNPGSGKSAIIHHIALKMGKQGFSIIPINRPDEIISYHDRRNQQVFVIDDPCGEFIVDEQAANVWSKYSKDIQTCLNFEQKGDKVKSKLLVSCRVRVSEARAFRMIKIFSNFKISLENQENYLSTSEKKQILSAHVKREEQSYHIDFMKKIDSFPLLCRIYANTFTGTESVCMDVFFNNPFIELVSKLDLMVSDPRTEAIHEYCVLVCCALTEKKLNLFLNGKENVADEHLQDIINACDMDIDFSKVNVLTVLRKLNGKYVKDVGSKYSLIHSKLLEIIVWHFGKRWPETLILHSSTEIFQGRLRLFRIQEDDYKEDLFLVGLDEKMLKTYAQRIQNDISQGLVGDVFKNPCMPKAQIETILFDLLKDGHILEETLLKTSCNLPSSNIEAYYSFLKEDLLGNSRVTFLHLTIAYSWATFLEKLFESENDTLCETILNQPASTLHLAILSENSHIVERFFQFYSRTFGSIADFMNLIEQFDADCLFCGTDLPTSGHDSTCPVEQIPIPLLVCRTGKLEILKYLVENAAYSMDSFNSEYTFLYDTLSPLMVGSMYGHIMIVRYLLQNGASANYQNPDGISALHEACYVGHLELIPVLISFGADVNIKDTNGETPFHFACKNNLTDIARQLLFKKADVNIQNSEGATALLNAVAAGDRNTAQFLIENKCDINIPSKKGDTPFSLACLHGDYDIFKLLLNKGVNMDQLYEGMLKACVKGHKKVVSMILDRGADINFKNMRGLSALHISCSENHSDLVTYLFSMKADPNIQSGNKLTPLHCAAKNFSVECVSILLKNEAEINAIDDRGRTALHYVIQAEGHKREYELKNEILPESIPDPKKNIHGQDYSQACKQIADILIKNKSNLNMSDINGCTPLNEACSGNIPEVVQKLIANYVNINAPDKQGCTPLHNACKNALSSSVKLIIENEGNVNAIDLEGSNPLHFACIRGHYEIVTILVENGASVNHPDKTGSTSLHIAVKNQHSNIISFLLFNGATVNAKDNKGLSPLILSCCQNDEKNVQKLLMYEADIDEEATEDGLNALTMAVTKENYDVADLLFNKGAQLHEKNYRYLLGSIPSERQIYQFLDKYGCVVNDYRNKKGQSFLHLATLEKKRNWVDSLLKKTELSVVLDNEGNTALFYTIENKLDDIYELFKENDMSDTATLAELQKACKIGNTLIVENFLAMKCVHVFEKNSESALSIAFNNGNHDFVRKLLRSGFSSCDKIINEALKLQKYFELYNIILAWLPDELWSFHKSVIPRLSPERGEKSRMNWIKQAEGIDQSLRSADLFQSLIRFEIWPVLFVREDAYRIIIKIIRQSRKNENLNFKDAIGNTLLHYIALIPQKRFKVMIDMIAFDISDKISSFMEMLNQQNIAGCTPLHYAIHSPLCTALLIKFGANVTIKDKSGHDALHYAITGNFESSKEILQNKYLIKGPTASA